MKKSVTEIWLDDKAQVVLPDGRVIYATITKIDFDGSFTLTTEYA